MFKTYAHANESTYDYQHIQQAIDFVKTTGHQKFLWRFHVYLQIVASHYTIDPEDSERVMVKYYEFMLRIKDYLKTHYSLDVLSNLDQFPLNTETMFCTVEQFWGQDVINKAYKIKRGEAVERITEQINVLNPNADAKKAKNL